MSKSSTNLFRIAKAVFLIAALSFGGSRTAHRHLARDGLAFHVFGIGLLGHATGAPALSIAIFTGSYLAGFLALIAPGGLMVREGVMLAALTGAGVGAGPAALLVVASRLWLTVIELVPPLLLLGTTRVTREA